MPCRISRTRRWTLLAFGIEPLLEVRELGAQRVERRLAVGLVPVEPGRGVGGDRIEVDGAGGQTWSAGGSWAHHVW